MYKTDLLEAANVKNKNENNTIYKKYYSKIYKFENGNMLVNEIGTEKAGGKKRRSSRAGPE